MWRRTIWSLVTIVSMSLSLTGQIKEDVLHTFFLIGDAGEISDGQQKILGVLQEQLETADQNSTVIYLGDNIYPKGLPDIDHPDRQVMEGKLVSQLLPLKDFKGSFYFLHGNHDWEKSKQDGWKRALNQEKFLREYFNKDSVMLPVQGCPGPEEISVSDDITLILMNSQWFLHPWDKPTVEDGCESISKLDALERLSEILKRNKHKQVILAQHHPLFTYGSHGGTYKLKDHFFPLTNLSHNLYIPLPVIGSIYPFYRTFLGSKQDTPNFEYKIFRNAMHEILRQHDNVIHTAGHEHSLQYIEKDSVKYIVSGSGAKSTPVRKSKNTLFRSKKYGFVVLKYLKTGGITMQYYAELNGKADLLYEKSLARIEVEVIPETTVDIVNEDSVNAFASNEYNIEAKGLLGKNYREVWQTPIKVPVFDIGKEHGGLKIVKRGGGMQTKSLRLESSTGRQYVLRSIAKYPENAIPRALRKTLAGNIVEDQISASHPYGAFVIPYLADAAGIYHTNPKVVYIPNDPRFGSYRADFANTLALYEERPDGKANDQDYFGNADNIVSTFRVIEQLREDNDNHVDEHFVLRNRLFDMLIGDWDRHDDQWRWAEFDEEKGELYRPIPRDRDQAFFVNEGLIPKIISRKWALPKIEGFDEEVDWAPGLMFNARYFDRSFLTSLSEEDWYQVAEDLKKRMTDEVIEKAIRQWPAEIFELTGEDVISALKARRNKLTESALEHYHYLAREVDVLGSDKNELFLVNRLPDGKVKVTVKKINKKDKVTKTLYERTFDKKQTKEIRLQGFDGQDVFEIDGDVNKSILVRVISGRGKDMITDRSSVSGWGKKTKIYDREKNTTIKAGDETKAILANDPSIHNYERKSFKYNTMMPIIDLNYNRDDGIFLGSGFIYTDHGWRKSPFESKHVFRANRAFATNSFNIKYQGVFTEVVGRWDLNMSADIQEPRVVSNYFGFGNNSVYDSDNRSIDFYRTRFENNTYTLGLSKNIGAKGDFSIAAMHRRVEIEDKDGENFIATQVDQGELPVDITSNAYTYTGLTSRLVFDTRDHVRLTKNGALWETTLTGLRGMNDNSSNMYQLASSFSSFIKIKIPAVFVLANRVGFSHNFGDLSSDEFFNASKLGGIENLRSYRRSRFHGRTSFYHNVDLRTKLFSFRTYLFPGELGILGFHDVGRVWAENEVSTRWHSSRGFGLWVAPAKEVVVSFNYGFSNDENLPFVQFGFFF